MKASYINILLIINILLFGRALGQTNIDVVEPWEYGFGNITCDSGTDCFVHCIANYSCYDAVINATLATSLYVSCVDFMSCYSISIYLPNNGDGTIHCNDSSNSSWWGACEWIQVFEGTNTQDISIYCGTIWECYYGDVFAWNAKSITAEFDHYYAGTAVWIYAENVTDGVSVACKDSNACIGIDVHCPDESTCDMDCYGLNSCRGMEFVIGSSDYDLLNVSCSAYANENVTSDWDCFEYSYVVCSDTEAQSLLSYNIWDDELSCHASCCPFEISEMSCDLGTGEMPGYPCVVDCTQRKCEGHLINATLYSSLTVICMNNTVGSTCDGLAIYCPYDGACDIACDMPYGCDSMYIVSGEHSDVSVDCTATMTFYHLVISADPADSLAIGATEYGSFYDAIIHAEGASEFNLTCKMADKKWADYEVCVYSSLYLADSTDSEIDIDCYGFGCVGLSFYSKQGFENVSNIDFGLESYGVCPCGKYKECLYWFRFVCGDSYDESSMYYGYYYNECSNSTCGCNAFMENVEEGYTTDNDKKSCNGDSNDSNDGLNSGDGGHLSGGTIAAIVITVLAVVAIILIMFWYFQKRQKEKQVQVDTNADNQAMAYDAVVIDNNNINKADVGGWDMTALDQGEHNNDVTTANAVNDDDDDGGNTATGAMPQETSQ